jgi:hypothetical protein
MKHLTEPFGKAGLIVAIVALVLALVGGAYAKGLFTKAQEKKIAQIAKKYAGVAGPVGPQGAAGIQGTSGSPGKEGHAGQAGSPGLDGEDGACSQSNPICVLPFGATETGRWSFLTASGDPQFLEASFPLAMPRIPSEAEIIKDSPTANCPGSFESPEAAPGHLCIYVGNLVNMAGPNFTSAYSGNEARRFGWVGEYVPVDPAAEAYGYGTWAVTACPASAPLCSS